MSTNEKTLHNRIAVLRAERNLSRQELADGLGINYQTVGFLERGDYNPSLALALDLSEFFQLPVEAIFSRRAFAPLSTQLYRTASSAIRETPSPADREDPAERKATR